MDESAVSSLDAEVIDANVSGNEVPMATMVIAVVASGISAQQPKSDAKSLIKAVTTATQVSATVKRRNPPAHIAGGQTMAKKTLKGRPKTKSM